MKWLREQRLQAYVDFLQSVAQVFDRHDAFVRFYKFKTQYPQIETSELEADRRKMVKEVKDSQVQFYDAYQRVKLLGSEPLQHAATMIRDYFRERDMEREFNDEVVAMVNAAQALFLQEARRELGNLDKPARKRQ